MGYVEVNDCRLLTGFTTDDISNDDLQDLIDLATEMIIEDVYISIVDEKLSGNINGSNTTFEVSNYPIADTTGSKTVGSGDVTVYQWTNNDDPSTKSTIAVSTVYSAEGKIILSSAPTSSVSQLTANYSFTYQDTTNWDLMKVACSYLAAFLFLVRTFTVLPDSYARGPMRYRHYVKPYNEYLEKYYDILSRIKSQIHVKKNMDDISLDRRRM